jgi:hypothetical protein
MSTRKTVLALDDGTRIVIVRPAPPTTLAPDDGGHGLPACWYPEWLPFSDLERDVLVLLIDEGGQSKKEIAAALQKSSEGLLGDVLANLVSRNVLTSGHDGYRFNMVAARRPAFRHWLAEQSPGQSKPRGGYRLSGPKLAPQEPRPDDVELAGRIAEAHEAKRRTTS